VTVQQNNEVEVLTEVNDSVTETAVPEVVSSLGPVLTNKELKSPRKQSIEQASELVLAQSTLEEKSPMTKIASNPKSVQRTGSSRNSRRSK
jgi:hypothetical protein